MVLELTHTINTLASVSGLGALGVSLKEFLIQLITFLLALFVLKKWAFSPIIKILGERRKVIEDGVKLGEKLRSDKAKVEEDIEAALHDARRKADQIIADAGQTARQLITEAETDAKKKSDIILHEAKQKTLQDIETARRRLESDIANLVAQATGAVLDEKVNAETDAGLIERALNSVRRTV